MKKFPRTETSGDLVFGPWSLANILGIDTTDLTCDIVERKTAKAVYKGTYSGVGVTFHADGEGITIHGYVELDSIGEVAVTPMTFPFTEEEFWEAVTYADDYAQMAWDAALLDAADVIDDDDAQRSADVNEVLR